MPHNELLRHQDDCCLVAPAEQRAGTWGLHAQLAASGDVLSALADPARQDLVQLLAHGESNVSDISARVTLSRPTVSHHLLILRRAGLVRVRKQGREVYYRLDSARLTGALRELVQCVPHGDTAAHLT
jgi:ArsR family transcriptional regulator, arsenate/arsenite/antimonite-responsive transcriptional repressor